MLDAQSFLELVGAQAAKRFRAGILPIVDLFSGAGGTAEGALEAFKELQLPVQLCAVNHWDIAIATHQNNHEGHLHFCTGVDRIDIRELLSEIDSDGIFGLLASPSCTTHSQARGGVPINPQERSSCQALLKWLRTNRAIHLWVENVPQFVKYGPLMQKKDKRGVPLFLRKNAKGQWKECTAPGLYRPAGIPAGKWWKRIEEEHGLKPAMIPDPSHNGEYFQKWVRGIRRLGYDVEWRVLNAADYGAPTKRLRLFIQGVLRNTGRKIVWPNPTHAEPDMAGVVAAGLYPWKTARQVIDRSNLGASIFGRKRQLADKTIDRIAVGVMRFGFAESIVKFKGTGTANSVNEPLGTVQAGGQHYGYLKPEQVSVILPQHRGRRDELRVFDVGQPLSTITGSGAEAVATAAAVDPFVITMEHKGSVRSLERPLPTITTAKGGAFAIAQASAFEPCLVEVNHGNGKEGDRANNRRAHSIGSPLGSLTASRGLALASPQPFTDPSTGEIAQKVTDWNSLAVVIKTGSERAKVEPSYRPLIEFEGVAFRLEIFFRMLKVRELARAQSFPDSYTFTGTDAQCVKMIGNAVPPALARALVKAAVSQNPDIGLSEADTERLSLVS